MDVHRNISTTNITIFNILINLLKGNLIFTLGQSVAIYKTISNTHITITLFKIPMDILKCT